MASAIVMNFALNDSVESAKPEWRRQWTVEDRNALLRYARQRLNDFEAAEDVVQDTLAAALAAGHQFEGRSKRLTWAFGILKHKIADYQRLRYRDRSRFVDRAAANREEDSEYWMSEAAHAQSELDNPARQCEHAEFWTVLQAGVDGLPSKTAEVFQRSFLRNDDSRDICRQMNISPSNYWVMLHRARKHLRQHLTKHWIEPQSTQYAPV